MLHADELRRAIETATRAGLSEVTALLWRAYSNGKVTETEAEALSGLIEARIAAPRDPREAPRATDPTPLAAAGIAKRWGSRPRTDGSLERRRRWATSGRMPPALACKFTQAEAAVLAVVAVEVGKAGACGLHIDHIAALAGVSRTSVKNALREARALGLVTVEARKPVAWRNDSNLVRIVSPEWLSWMRLARRETRIPVEGGGVKSATGTNTSSPESSSRGSGFRRNSSARGARSDRQGQHGHCVHAEGSGRPRPDQSQQP